MSDTPKFDVVIVGAGPGGYVCAIRCAQLGMNVALVEKDRTLGGTCLNVGCIPTKALLHSTEIIHTVQTAGARHGLKCSGLELDLEALMQRKEAVVSRLVKGVEQLVKARKVQIIHGHGRLLGPGRIEVRETPEGPPRCLHGTHLVLAAGSLPADLAQVPTDGEKVVTSDQAIAFSSVPKRLVVVGAGAIGLEIGSVWARLGSKVTILEFLPQIAPGYDEDVAKFSERLFKRQGLAIETATQVTGLEEKSDGLVVTAQSKGKDRSYPADKVRVAVGRRPASQGLGLVEAGLALDQKGRVVTDHQFRTNLPGVFAIGDLIAGPMLAHKAEEDGVAVAEIIAGRPGQVHYDHIPTVVYTWPELAAAGLTERIARERGIEVKTSKFPLSGNGRALAMDASEGLVKVVAESRSDRLLGVQIVSPSASELIATVVAHLEYGGSAEDLGKTVFAHPTLSEAIKEAALGIDKSSIHGL